MMRLTTPETKESPFMNARDEVKTPYRVLQFQMREAAILDAVHALLGRKGYDLMTMDDLAAEVGIAKGSLYKHFPSKEKLASAAMIRLLRRTLLQLASMPASKSALATLRQLLEWALSERLKGSIPHLPSTSSTLQQALTGDLDYLSSLMELNAHILALVETAKAQGDIASALPSEFVMMTIYARTCDATLDFLKDSNAYSDEEIVAIMTHACFDGLASRPTKA
jgi:AcrR family transcriptional regulator